MEKNDAGKKPAPKKKGKKNEPEPPPPPPPPKKSRKKIFLMVFMGGVFAIGGAFALLYLLSGEKEEKPAEYPALALPYIPMEEELLNFTWQHIPQSYEALIGLNAEISLITEEIERIESIATRFPEQRRITQVEIREWESLKREIETGLSRSATALQALHVTFLVNPEKGKSSIAAEAGAITSNLQSMHQTSREKTLRLNPDPLRPDPSFFKKITKWLPW
ncbi:hypothetical protein [Desulfobotulus mexicanus]|uniref:Uncharacterized protein n=1 Tax=Desulfobotulus mexicanus TaxID=2586642 RepID=A0A5S5MFS5_9BACT|nr:hypothetical protein [Desulfobotulus mexicanus]TYT74485.1 hypothetical protein FIM25_10045 [Desulfobotulus mexicanus]